MAETRSCHFCAKTESDGPWTYFVRAHWPFLVSVCNGCLKNHVAVGKVAWKAWFKKWLWACLFLWALSWGLMLGSEWVAGILPLRVVEIPKVRSQWVELPEPTRIVVDGHVYEITAQEVREGEFEADEARRRNILYKENVVFGAAVLLQSFAWALCWWSYRRARKNAALTRRPAPQT